jgi:hypothetical protein
VAPMMEGDRGKPSGAYPVPLRRMRERQPVKKVMDLGSEPCTGEVLRRRYYHRARRCRRDLHCRAAGRRAAARHGVSGR